MWAWRLGSGFAALRRRGRLVAGAAAAALALLGLGFSRLLVADDGDNAYLGLYLIGLLLIAAAAPFVLAAVWPAASPWPLRTALALLWAAGAFALALIVVALLAIPGEDHRDERIFRSHLLGLVALAAALPALSATVIRGAH